MTGWPATCITVCPRETRLVAVIPRTSICFCSSMIAESSKAGFLIILISDPESGSKLVLVFKSGETIRAVGVVGESFNFIEIIRRGRLPHLIPVPGGFPSSVPSVLVFPFGLEIPDSLFLFSRGCAMVPPQYLMCSGTRQQIPLHGTN